MSLRITLIFVFLLLLTACTSSDTDSDPAVRAVESYLQAKISGDEDGIRSWICSDLESIIENETASFASVEASLEDMSCSSNENIVSCTGNIVALYGTETREFPLSTYRVVQEDGEWRWCGEGA